MIAKCSATQTRSEA